MHYFKTVINMNCWIQSFRKQYWVEKTDGEIKNGQSKDTGNIGHKTQNKDKQMKKTQDRKTKMMGNTNSTKTTQSLVKDMQFLFMEATRLELIAHPVWQNNIDI